MPRQAAGITHDSGTSSETPLTAMLYVARVLAFAPVECRQFRCGRGAGCNKSGKPRAFVRGQAGSRTKSGQATLPGSFGSCVQRTDETSERAEPTSPPQCRVRAGWLASDGI